MEQQAKWIRTPEKYGEMSPEFRKEFSLKGAVKKATATVTTMGVYNLYVNGKKAGNAVLAPYWTSYPARVQEQEYDITNLLAENNTVGILVGKGWAMGKMGYNPEKYFTGYFAENLSLIASITVEYEDGTADVIATDDSWQVFSSQILDSEMYHRETVDHNAEVKFLANAVLDTFKRPEIIPQQGEYVTEKERLSPCEVIITPKGETVLDFGQNLAGYVEVKIQGKKGDKIVMTHAEVLDSDGNFYTANLRTAKNRNEYILSGEGEEVFKPLFCFQGFRYIRLDEFPAGVEVKPENFTAIAIYSDMKRTGNFSCGNDKINQLYSNIIWGHRGNFIDLPTDCPQRDERLGWTGDAQVFCRTAAINYDVEKFFTKWLADMAIEQTPEGGIWGIVPKVGECGERISAAWADAATICPWEIYRAYGNKELLRSNFDMMKKWIGYLHNYGEDEFLFVGARHYGDWLAMDAGYGICEGATQTDFIASAFFAYSTELVIKAGKILGEDVSEFE
ncbi:MAG: family 78 glycoside hydrolase catalytic domain, partial [Clostridia bacterium]|nr:family 78 glycoside hydrolase catalytic domain [Clostridia bacterium]